MPFRYGPSEVRRGTTGKKKHGGNPREDEGTLLFHFTFITETVEY